MVCSFDSLKAGFFQNKCKLKRELFMQPASAAFLRLLLRLRFLTIKLGSPVFPRLLAGNVHPDEFGPSTNLRVRRYIPVHVCYLMLLQDFLEVQCLVVARGMDYGALLHKEVAIVGSGNAFGSYLVVYSFLPQFFPFNFECFSHFFLRHTNRYEIPP